jgi:hypothetical protein
VIDSENASKSYPFASFAHFYFPSRANRKNCARLEEIKRGSFNYCACERRTPSAPNVLWYRLTMTVDDLKLSPFPGDDPQRTIDE